MKLSSKQQFLTTISILKVSKGDSNAIIMPHLNPFCGGFSTTIEAFSLMLKKSDLFLCKHTPNCQS